MMIYELKSFVPGKSITVASKMFKWMIGDQVITYQVDVRTGRAEHQPPDRQPPRETAEVVCSGR